MALHRVVCLILCLVQVTLGTVPNSQPLTSSNGQQTLELRGQPSNPWDVGSMDDAMYFEQYVDQSPYAEAYTEPYATNYQPTFTVVNDPRCGQTPLCNVTNRSFQRIVGGYDATIECAPWQGSLQVFGQAVGEPSATWHHFCGCSLVNQKYVLTAAHCAKYMRSLRRLPLSVVFGTTCWATGGQRYFINNDRESIIVNPDFRAFTLRNDLAVCKVQGTIEYSDLVLPICMPTPYENCLGDLILYGWGITEDDAVDVPPCLQGLDTQGLPASACSGYRNAFFDAGEICSATPGTGACSGDSGGALVKRVSNSDQAARYAQCGIVSYGSSLGCAAPGFPSVYTRVSYYLEFIARNTALSIPYAANYYY